MGSIDKLKDPLSLLQTCQLSKQPIRVFPAEIRPRTCTGSLLGYVLSVEFDYLLNSISFDSNYGAEQAAFEKTRNL